MGDFQLLRNSLALSHMQRLADTDYCDPAAFGTRHSAKLAHKPIADCRLPVDHQIVITTNRFVLLRVEPQCYIIGIGSAIQASPRMLPVSSICMLSIQRMTRMEASESEDADDMISADLLAIIAFASASNQPSGFTRLAQAMYKGHGDRESRGGRWRMPPHLGHITSIMPDNGETGPQSQQYHVRCAAISSNVMHLRPNDSSKSALNAVSGDSV